MFTPRFSSKKMHSPKRCFVTKSRFNIPIERLKISELDMFSARKKIIQTQDSWVHFFRISDSLDVLYGNDVKNT